MPSCILLALDDYVTQHRFATAMTSPADLDLRAEQLVQPDVFVAEGIGDREWKAVGIPLLVAEVLSPSRDSIDRDVNVKRERYQRSGVPTYWIVDVEQELVEVWTPDTVAPRVERALRLPHHAHAVTAPSPPGWSPSASRG